MLFKLFQTNVIFGYVLSYVITIILFGLSWQNFSIEPNTTLYYLLGEHPIATNSLAIIIVASLPLSIISFYTRNGLHPKSLFFEYFLFLILITPIVLQFNWIDLVIIPLLIEVLNQIFKTYNKTKVLTECFQTGLFFGLASIINPNVLFIFPFLFVATAVYRSFNIGDFIYILLGTVLGPLLAYGFDINDHLGLLSQYEAFFNDFSFSLYASPHQLYELIPAGIFSLIAIFHLFRRVTFLNIRQQLNRYVIIWLILFSSIMLFNEKSIWLGLFLIALAVSVPLNHQFKNIKKPILSDLELLFILGASLYLSLF